MEIELAKALEEMEFDELLDVLTKLMMENKEAFDELKELVDDQI